MSISSSSSNNTCRSRRVEPNSIPSTHHKHSVTGTRKLTMHQAWRSQLPKQFKPRHVAVRSCNVFTFQVRQAQCVLVYIPPTCQHLWKKGFSRTSTSISLSALTPYTRTYLWLVHVGVLQVNQHITECRRDAHAELQLVDRHTRKLGPAQGMMRGLNT
jgi:hypothetical protein